MTNLQDMIQSIQQRRFIDTHPLEELQDKGVMLAGIQGILNRLTWYEADWLMMCYPVA